jgi:hypothetical protein
MRNITRIAALAILVLTSTSHAAVPQLINFQSLLTDSAGTPIANGNYSVVFTIWDAAAAGTSVWTETQNITTSGGLFDVLLGSVNPVEDTVFNGTTRYLGIAVDSDPEMSPRTALVSVPYSQRVSTVDGASGGTISGNLGIGNVTPGVRLDVNTDASTIARFQSSNNFSYVNFSHTGAGSRLWALHTGVGSGTGKFAIQDRTAVKNRLVIDTAGHVGINKDNPVAFLHILGGGAPSLIAESGQAQFWHTSESGPALFASNLQGGGAAAFNGNVLVTGSVSKSGGSFRIDHPLDPEHKYLYHSFVESPDMMNLYNGNIVTDAQGFATVVMPDYFDALNKDFRYQLTVIGTFSQAIVAKKISNGTFTIQTEKPNVEVSWQVTGVRQDAWANAHRIQTEVAKKPEERGLYIHPELFGQPMEKSISTLSRADRLDSPAENE